MIRDSEEGCVKWAGPSVIGEEITATKNLIQEARRTDNEEKAVDYFEVKIRVTGDPGISPSEIRDMMEYICRKAQVQLKQSKEEDFEAGEWHMDVSIWGENCTSGTIRARTSSKEEETRLVEAGAFSYVAGHSGWAAVSSSSDRTRCPELFEEVFGGNANGTGARGVWRRGRPHGPLSAPPGL